MNFTAQNIAEIVDGEIIGNPNIQVKNLSKIEDGKPGDLCFLANPKYAEYVYSSLASIIIVDKSFITNKKINTTLIKVNDPYSSFSQLLDIYHKNQFDKIGISKNADIEDNVIVKKDVFIGSFTYIDKNVIIAQNTKIHANCFIGKNVTIGKNTVIFPGVTIYHDCIIGENNIIHSGSIIGADGFGFAPNKDTNYNKIKQIGNVITKNNVEIGANTTIDRATMGSTIINDGVKLDNLIQIGHNVEIGKHTVIAAQVAVAGSTKIGEKCMIGGQTAISGHLKIANKVKVAGQSGIAKSIEKEGSVMQGPMAFNIKDFQRSYIIFKKLPDIYKQIEKINNKIKKYESENN